MSTPTTLRSLLFIPGNQPKMLDKAMGFRPEAYVPDMEDSVPDAEKTNAREVIAAHLPRLATSGIPVIPRVNGLDTGLSAADLAAVVGPHVYGISIGKVRTPEDVGTIVAIIEDLERKASMSVGSTRLILWIETALAIVHCYEICAASPRVVGIAFGAEDFTDDMAIERSEDEAELEFARSTVCVAARAAGVLALDTPFFGFRDDAGLRANALKSKRQGFKGKFAIHPAQVDTIGEVFSPSAAEIAQAERVVAAFEEAERAGRGSTSLDGQVIDVPVFKRARALLETARALRDA